MSLALLSTDGFLFLARWLHFFFGVIWIGLLYYFNFVQGSFFAETDATTKSNAIQKLVPRALWWFRWGAMFTFLTGLVYLAYRGHQGGLDVFRTSWGIAILTGGGLGTMMWANVWFAIWPNQQIVIRSATQAATGGQAIPEAAAAAKMAGGMSRVNVLFSIPMLFFMGAASHLPIEVRPEANLAILATGLMAIIFGIETCALKGKTSLITTIKQVITSGFVLAGILYVVVEILTKI